MVHFWNLLLFCATKRCFYRESNNLLGILTESLASIELSLKRMTLEVSYEYT